MERRNWKVMRRQMMIEKVMGNLKMTLMVMLMMKGRQIRKQRRREKQSVTLMQKVRRKEMMKLWQ